MLGHRHDARVTRKKKRSDPAGEDLEISIGLQARFQPHRHLYQDLQAPPSDRHSAPSPEHILQWPFRQGQSITNAAKRTTELLM
jgi:hypothetical protein